MIGVIANPEDHAVVEEFFELFKTPWEFYRSGRDYDVLLCDGDYQLQGSEVKLVVIYSSQQLPLDGKTEAHNGKDFQYTGTRLPIYGPAITFSDKAPSFLKTESNTAAAYAGRSGDVVKARIGYDLFPEIRALLVNGQPIANAAVPTLDLHIELLRSLIVSNDIPLVEIPAVPEGHSFIACLTHDVDHPTMRPHKFDHTMLGFLYRATVGSVMNFVRGRVTVEDVFTNWGAALKLPFVHLGMAKDSWFQFDRYLQLEKGHRSSFFVIPFKDRPGLAEQGSAPKIRACSYTMDGIAQPLKNLLAGGCEIGLHGIDAWKDSAKGTEELQQIRKFTGEQEVGVRMHWLYFNKQSPMTLEKAGATYDSTVGYNETIGYRAGTTQTYKPLQVTQLMELPMHVMDTALFYPSYLNLHPRDAGKQVSGVINHATRFGGSVTVNWHDRSIFPERLWDKFYVGLISEFESKNAWFATASQAVSWFRKRRSATFEAMRWEGDALQANIAVGKEDDLPSLRLRIHRNTRDYRDIVLDGSINTRITV